MKLWQGLLMIAMNFGTKHVVAELTPLQERIMASEIVKRIVVFGIFFSATRDVLCSMSLTGMYTLIMSTLMNETSKFFLFDYNKQNSEEQDESPSVVVD